jgi:hypothetical protein
MAVCFLKRLLPAQFSVVLDSKQRFTCPGVLFESMFTLSRRPSFDPREFLNIHISYRLGKLDLFFHALRGILSQRAPAKSAN